MNSTWVNFHLFVSYNCMTSFTTQRILFQFEQILHLCQLITSAYMFDSIAWWVAHGSLSRARKTIFHLGLVSLSWCLTALKLGPETSFCLLYIQSFLSFSCLAGVQFADCITCLAAQKILFQFECTIVFFPVHS